MSISSSKGFVLFVALLFISFMMMLSLTQWQSLILMQRTIHHQRAREEALRALEQGWIALQGRLTLDAAEGEWMSHGHKVHYRIQPLGEFPCIRQIVGGVTYSTLQAWVSLSSETSATLVLRVAEPIPIKPCQAHAVRYVKTGVLSWLLRHST